MRRGLYLLTLWAALASHPVKAGPVEQMVDVAFGQGTAALSLVVRYENGGGGLLFGTLGSSSWRLQCGSAFLQPGETSRGPLVALANGPVLVPTSRGVVAGTQEGCDYQFESPLPGAQVIDLQSDPADPHSALGLFNVSGMPTGSTSLMRRTSSGVWSMLGRAENAVSTGMRATLLNSGSVRIYQTLLVPVLDDDGGVRDPKYKLRYSDDGARSFREHELSTDGPPRVVAIDPTKPERVVLMIERAKAGQRIMVSPDAGETLQAYVDIEKLGGIAFAPDGRVWIGSRSDSGNPEAGGIWAADNLDTAPTRLSMSDYTVQCLGYHVASETLFACQHFWLGEVDKASGAFETQLSFSKVTDFVRCDGAAERCEPQLCAAYCGPAHFAAAPMCAAYDEPECGRPVAAQEGASLGGSDAGVPQPPAAAGKAGSQGPLAGSSGAEAAQPKSSSGCGCSSLGARPRPLTAWLLLMAWLALRALTLRRLQARRAVANTR